MRFPAPLVLLLSFGLMVSSAVRKSPTVDEQSHLFRGVAYVKTGAAHFLWGHPLLSGALSALPLVVASDLRLPLEEPAWAAGEWAQAGDAFLWRLNSNPQRLIFLGRLPTMWLTLLLGALVFRWGQAVAGAAAGLLALSLLLLDPNVLAHGQLVTSDLPLTLFMTTAVYGYWRWAVVAGRAGRLALTGARRPVANLLLGGMGLGAAAATKFNAALLLPALGALASLVAIRWRSGPALAALLFMGGVAGLAVWAIYGFAWRPLPGGAFWLDLAWQLDYLSSPHGAYLAGRYDPRGWWYYFPVAFLLKTPLPTLLLLLWAGGRWLGGRKAGRSVSSQEGQPASIHFMWLPAAVYLAISLASPLNVGYRHLIPALPFLALFIAVTLAPGEAAAARGSFAHRLAPYGLSALVALASLLAWPDYIPYFNGLAGGPARSWRLLSDSNVDWGQDLPALAAWQQRTGHQLKLSYFGTAHPSAYGLQFDPLPTWGPGPEQANPARQAFHPADPAPGVYAISVTNLHGLVLGAERDTFAWFRDREPLTRVGGSIFLYEVEPAGEPAQVAFAGLRPAELDPALHARLQTNDVRVRWFDGRTSLVWPAGGGWLAVGGGQTPDPALSPFWPSDPLAQEDGQSLYRIADNPPADWSGRPADLGGVVTFLGYRSLDAPPGEISLVTAWRVIEATGRPLKVFVHALGEDGAIAGQWDGLDVDPLTWGPGDVFVQLHRFALPPAAGAVNLTVGLYDGETLERVADPWPLEAR